MRISNCIECNEYKYLEENGKCRNCINHNKIHIGKSSKKVFINKSNIYNNINIIGMVGSGKTTLQKHLINEIINKKYGLFYFDIHSEIQKDDFKNISKINVDKNTINLFIPERNKNHNKYIEEVNLMTKSILKTIQQYSKNIFNQKIKKDVLNTLKNIIKLVIDSDYMYKFEHIFKCLIAKSIRKSTINKKHKNLKIDNNIKNINKKKHYFMLNVIRELSSSLDYTFVNDNSKINIKNMISNSEKIIFDLSDSKNNTSIKSLFMTQKIYNEIKLQNNDKYIFGLNNVNSLYNSLTQEFQKAKNYNICFINITQEPDKIQQIINKSDINIYFSLPNMSKISKLNISASKISLLNQHEFILKTPNKTIYPVKLQI